MRKDKEYSSCSSISSVHTCRDVPGGKGEIVLSFDMKKFSKILLWTGMVLLAFMLALSLALRQMPRSNATIPQNAQQVTQLKLKNPIRCGFSYNPNVLAVLAARNKAALKK
jgi:hypothetical protein